MADNFDIKNHRHPEHNIDPLFWQRWSPRSFSGEGISSQQLDILFEAARWAPSCFNEQPWRFLYAHRDSSDWNTFLKLLMEGNQSWAQQASVLIVVLSKKTFSHNGNNNGSHSFDSGSAWQNIALQASTMGLACHGMAGIHYEDITRQLKIPDDFKVEMMLAVGVPADASKLPEALQERERPSPRKTVAEISFAGEFPEN